MCHSYRPCPLEPTFHDKRTQHEKLVRCNSRKPCAAMKAQHRKKKKHQSELCSQQAVECQIILVFPEYLINHFREVRTSSAVPA